MALIVVGSAKGAPGASTLALALAAAWPGGVRPLVVEADAAGGDALLRFGMRESPGLVSLAAGSRRAGVTTASLREHAQRLPGGVEMVIAPAEAGQCAATLDALAPVWVEAELDGAVVLADCGRLPLGASATTALLGIADALILVSGGSVEALAHTAETADRLRPSIHFLVVAVVGRCAWPAREVETALGADACVMLPYDPASGALLRGAPMPRRRWPAKARHPLMDAARGLAMELERQLPENLAPDENPQPAAASAAERADLASALGGERR
ncbi:hypothetical protein [Kitasatospora azatica]|uniref:hypothetical protein n=1 Tax=Kitasatospora azatica TaxID=58347 RepID=UPI00068A6982|nr:hypothetical protein [Kitasatospora azatica]